jgi:signal transduction histidine kinase
LRTPVQPILGILELLHSKKTEIRKQELDQSLDLIIRNAYRLKHLVEDILDVTRIESETLVILKELLDLNDVIAGIVQDTLRNQFDSKRVQILYEPIEDSIHIQADKFRLSQVVNNLLSNAVKFTNQNGGSIRIGIGSRQIVIDSMMWLLTVSRIPVSV